jgi:hypothetical protein
MGEAGSVSMQSKWYRSCHKPRVVFTVYGLEQAP